MNHLIFSKVPVQGYLYDKHLDFDCIFLLTDNKYVGGYIKAGFKNVFSFDEYTTNEKVLEKAAEIIVDHNIELIHVMDESDVERAALLREKFNISGQKSVSAKLFRDKYLMKSKLRNVIKTPSFSKVETFKNIKNFVLENGLPVVLKPRNSWSSKNISKISDESFMVNAVISSDFMIESWVPDSKMYTVDGIQENGSVKWFGIHEYDKNLLDTLEDNLDGYSMYTSPKMIDKEFTDSVKIYTEKILKVLNGGDMFISPFHLEFFCNKSGEFIFCEIASRFGGAKTVDIINKSYGIDLAEVFLKYLLKVPQSDLPNSPKKYVASYKKYYLSNLRLLDDIKSEEWFDCVFETKSSVDDVKPSSTNSFSQLYMFEAETYAEFVHRLNLVKAI